MWDAPVGTFAPLTLTICAAPRPPLRAGGRSSGRRGVLATGAGAVAPRGLRAGDGGPGRRERWPERADPGLRGT